MRVLGVIATCAAMANSAVAQERVVAIRGGEVLTVSSGAIANGVVVFHRGKIVAVGSADRTPIPTDAEVIDGRGLLVAPGAIDARATLGVATSGVIDPRTIVASAPTDGWESTRPLVPALRIIESFQLPRDPDWLREGVTTVYVTPGSENPLGGLGAVVKLAGGANGTVVRENAGMSASLGDIPRSSFAQGPTSRMGEVFLIRDALVRARTHLTSLRQGGATRDLGAESLGEVLERRVPLRVHANSAADILTALRLGREFDLRVVIDVGAAAHTVASELARAGVPVVVGPTIVGGLVRQELEQQRPENAALLYGAGVKIALATDDAGGRSVILEAALAQAYGLPRDAALRAITLDAAEILGVRDRLGSIEVGKDADLVVWRGHPLSTWGRTELVIVGGEIVFRRGPR